MMAIETELMTPSEVATLFRVDPKTVARWADSGKLPSIRTLGDHRRFPRKEVLAVVEKLQVEGVNISLDGE
ncbi:helix-turn-helix domain-containing protein [Trueperella pyogenes]|uniref:BldC family transcriptional regulator n=1 Tax=Trueperella pyogenes TaxID=1661 RepID=UPI000F8511AA|nr:BldC family transcriptional regulator [Trueperella pyogenes]AZR02795.1 helix-turn-helix domain-containing protein [Trueperella pyogenes]